MIDLRERFEDFGGVEAPDLWDRIEQQSTVTAIRRVRRWRPLSAALAAAAVVLLVMGGMAWLLRGDTEAPAADEPGPTAAPQPEPTMAPELGPTPTEAPSVTRAPVIPEPTDSSDDPVPPPEEPSSTAAPVPMVQIPVMRYFELEEHWDAAVDVLTAAGFEVELVVLFVPLEERENEGLIAYIDPEPGTIAPAGSTVVLAVYGGEEGPDLTADKPGGQWTTFTQDDGLASDCVSGGVDVGPEGVVWVGCTDGLSKFDGSMWAVVSEDVVCDSVTVGAAGEVWILACDADSNLTVLRFDGEWTEFLTVDMGELAVAPDGTVWLAAGSMWRFEGEGFQQMTDGETGPSLWEVTVGGDGVVWAAGPEAGLWRYDGEWTAIPDRPEYIAADPAGRLWAGYEGASFYDGRAWHERGLDGIRTIDFAFGPDDVVWVASGHSGAFRYDGDGWTQYTVADGLASNNLTSVAIAPDGTVWFGTEDSGVSRFVPSN